VRIGTRLFIALAIPIAILIAGFAILEDGANRMRSRVEVTREGRIMARTVQIATANALRDRKLSDVHSLSDDISGHESILGVQLFDVTGQLSYAPPPVRSVAIPPPDEVRRAMRGSKILQNRYTIDRQSVIAWLDPIEGPGGEPLGAVQVLQFDTFVDEDAAASSRAIAAFAAALFLAVALTVFIVTRLSVANPIEKLAQSVRGIGDGDWRAPVPVGSDDELGRLAREFNLMNQRLEVAHAKLVHEQRERQRVEQDLREAERLASLGRFAAGVAHEIGTPLNVIGGRTESLLRRSGADADAQRSMRIITRQIERIARIVHGVLDFARARDLRITPTGIAEVLAHVAELVGDRFEAHGIAFEIGVPPDLAPIAADADQLQQVFLNLALNAADAMPNGGALRVTAGSCDRLRSAESREPRHCVAVTFEDTGAGIAPQDLDRVFEPFFTTKEVGSGTGLGLAISYGIVREHGGWIELRSEPGRGTCATVWLPLEQPTSRAAARGPAEAA
jgi:signal transduction histidine kinase